MEYFLDNFQLRKIQLLNLLDSEERFFSINELAEQMNVSNPTVDKTFEAAKSDCNLHRLPIVFERRDPPLRSVAIHRRFDENSQSLSLRKMYIIESLNYRLLKDVFFEHFSDVKTFAQEQFTSHSLIYNKLGQLKEMLTQFDLALDLGQHFHLVGNERQIRFLFVNLFWNTYNDFDWPLQSHKEQFNPLLDEMERLLQMRLSPLKREYYRLWLGVCLTRIEKGYLLSPAILPKLKAITKQHPLANRLKIQFKQLLPGETSDEILDDEFSFLLLVLYSFDIRASYQRQITNPHLSIIYQLTKGKMEYQTQLFLHDLLSPLKDVLKVQDFEHFYLNMLNIQLRYSFFFGSVGNFHPKENASCHLSEIFFYNYVKNKYTANQSVTFLDEAGLNHRLFLEDTTHLLYQGLQSRGYFPKMNFLILWPTPNERLPIEITKYLPCYEIHYHSDLSSCQEFDLVISVDFYHDMKNIAPEKTIYINRNYSKKDLIRIQKFAEKIYLNKIKALFSLDKDAPAH